MLIPLGGYAGSQSVGLREMVGIILAALFCLTLFYIVGMAYLMACIFIAEVLGNQMLFPLMFFAIPMLGLLIRKLLP